MGVAWLLLLVASGSRCRLPSWAQVPTEADVYVDRGIVAYEAKQYP